MSSAAPRRRLNTDRTVQTFVEKPTGHRVFVPQHNSRSPIDLSDLDRFGERVVVAFRHTYPDEDEAGDRVIEEAATALQDFDPRLDYLALVGSYAHMAACMYVLGSLGKSPVAILVYDRKFHQYYPVDFTQEKLHESRRILDSEGVNPR